MPEFPEAKHQESNCLVPSRKKTFNEAFRTNLTAICYGCLLFNYLVLGMPCTRLWWILILEHTLASVRLAASWQDSATAQRSKKLKVPPLKILKALKSSRGV